MKYNFLRACSISPFLTVADCKSNAQTIIKYIKEANEKKAELIVFPELSITGYTCADLFLQDTLLENAVKALELIIEETQKINSIVITGLPLRVENALYNCAAVIQNGKLLALVPKTYVPNYCEFYEKRWFQSGDLCSTTEVNLSSKLTEIPFGSNILIEDINNPLFVLGIEICEDLWVPCPPSVPLSILGATVIANPSASNEIIGKAEYRRLLVKGHSAHIQSAYIYSDAGHDESTTDMVFAGHNIIAENGTILAESQLFSEGALYADIDLGRLSHDRRKTNTFSDSNLMFHNMSVRKISVDLSDKSTIFGFSSHKDKDSKIELLRQIEQHPFVPEGTKERSIRCKSVIELQAEGLAKRLRHINAKNAVIGLSGGLDSTLALLVTELAFKKCSLDTKGIHCITMPCFGTTNRTKSNACKLAQSLNTSLKEIDISKAVRQHFIDIEQDENIHDLTYENCQARERTQILMDLANKTNGIVIGTGDLSELALGWCTYNGDHMSMYGVNASIPKTLVKYLVAWFADEAQLNGKTELSSVLKDILDTPVSPELLPPENGNISQKTEDLVGPYELHDFFLYYVLRWGFSPSKIYFLAKKAFEKKYENEIILKWLKNFYKRFFSQQFKRSCMPDGAKVGSVCLSPRGDWRMPSDASSKIWLDEIENLD